MENKVRFIALNVINKVAIEHAYTNIELNRAIEDSNLNKKDIPLLTELVYGTIENYILLEFYLEDFIRGKILKPWVKNLLLMSIYQVVKLDKIPDYAIISEAVNIAKYKGNIGLSKLVNGVLRTFLRENLKDVFAISNKYVKYSIIYSHPLYLVKEIIDQYGEDTAIKIFEANNSRPKNSARINQNEISIEDLKKKYSVSKSILSEDGVIFNHNIASLPEFKQGKITIQDESSQLVANYVDPKPNEKILDCCSAPGGKAVHIGQLEPKCIIDAFDISSQKVNMIKGAAKRMRVRNLNIFTDDATTYKKDNYYDKVLIDAPCSGWGVIARKPDIKLNKQKEDISELLDIQRNILANIEKTLKKDGYLIYSTCTINKQENEQQAKWFLDNYSNYKLEEERIILPHEYLSDGFYIAKFKKIS